MHSKLQKRGFNSLTGKFNSVLFIFFILVMGAALPARAQNLQRLDTPQATNSISNIHGNQLVLIIHGWDTGSTGKPAWLDSMRDAIAKNFLGNERNYVDIEVVKNGSGLTSSCKFLNDSLSAGKTGTILATLDWSSVANNLTGGVSAQKVAAAVVDLLTESQSGHTPLAELPIHLIGHSRGGGLVCDLARLLGEQGLVVDQVTTLDPHPLTTKDPQPAVGRPVIDTPVAIYENTIFNDCYYQKSAYPQGESLTSAYNRWFPSLPGGYSNSSQVFAAHRNVYLMYQGTIDLSNPVNNNEASMGSKERSAWFNSYEEDGARTGFCYSRIKNSCARTSSDTPVAGGDQVKHGLHPALGGSGERQALTWDNSDWPNIAALQVNLGAKHSKTGVYAIPTGSVIELSCTALDYNNKYDINVFADRDRNPYNNNNLATIAQSKANPATKNSFYQHTFNWDSADMADGDQVYLYAEISDSKHSRYFYADASLLFTSDKYNYYVPYFQSDDGYWTGVAITNLDSANSNPCTITLYAADGTILNSEYLQPLPPSGQTALAVAQGSPSSGWIKVGSRRPVSGLSFLGKDCMIDMPFSEKLFTRSVIPHIAQTETWDTIIYICNPGSKVTDFNLTFTAENGVTTLTHKETLPADGSSSYPLSTVFPEQSSLSGCITITSDQGITAFALYTDKKSGGNYCAGIDAQGYELSQE